MLSLLYFENRQRLPVKKLLDAFRYDKGPKKSGKDCVNMFSFIERETKLERFAKNAGRDPTKRLL